MSVFLLLGRPLTTSATPGERFTLSPNSASYDNGTTFTVTVYSVSTDTINAVEADLNYDAAKLQFGAIGSGSSAYDVGAPSSGGSGSVTINKGSVSGVSGTSIVATVTFTVLAGSGSTAVTFAGSSHMYQMGTGIDVWDGTTAGGTYTLTTPSSGGGGGGGTTTTTTTTSGSGGTTTTPAKKTTTTAAKPAAATPAAVIPTDQPVVVQKDTSGSGYLVAIKILTSKNQAVKGAVVKLDGKTATSDSTGLASFSNIAAGTYKAAVTSGKVSAQQSVTVAAGNTSTAQKFSVVLPAPKTSMLPILSAIGGGVIVLAAAGFLVFKTMMAKRAVGAVPAFSAAPAASATPAPVVTAPVPTAATVPSTTPIPSVTTPNVITPSAKPTKIQ